MPPPTLAQLEQSKRSRDAARAAATSFDLPNLTPSLYGSAVPHTADLAITPYPAPPAAASTPYPAAASTPGFDNLITSLLSDDDNTYIEPASPALLADESSLHLPDYTLPAVAPRAPKVKTRKTNQGKPPQEWDILARTIELHRLADSPGPLVLSAECSFYYELDTEPGDIYLDMRDRIITQHTVTVDDTKQLRTSWKSALDAAAHVLVMAALEAASHIGAASPYRLDEPTQNAFTEHKMPSIARTLLQYEYISFFTDDLQRSLYVALHRLLGPYTYHFTITEVFLLRRSGITFIQMRDMKLAQDGIKAGIGRMRLQVVKDESKGWGGVMRQRVATGKRFIWYSAETHHKTTDSVPSGPPSRPVHAVFDAHLFTMFVCVMANQMRRIGGFDPVVALEGLRLAAFNRERLAIEWTEGPEADAALVTQYRSLSVLYRNIRLIANPPPPPPDSRPWTKDEKDLEIALVDEAVYSLVDVANRHAHGFIPIYIRLGTEARLGYRAAWLSDIPEEEYHSTRSAVQPIYYKQMIIQEKKPKDDEGLDEDQAPAQAQARARAQAPAQPRKRKHTETGRVAASPTELPTYDDDLAEFTRVRRPILVNSPSALVASPVASPTAFGTSPVAAAAPPSDTEMYIIALQSLSGYVGPTPAGQAQTAPPVAQAAQAAPALAPPAPASLADTRLWQEWKVTAEPGSAMWSVHQRLLVVARHFMKHNEDINISVEAIAGATIVLPPITGLVPRASIDKALLRPFGAAAGFDSWMAANPGIFKRNQGFRVALALRLLAPSYPNPAAFLHAYAPEFFDPIPGAPGSPAPAPSSPITPPFVFGFRRNPNTGHVELSVDVDE